MRMITLILTKQVGEKGEKMQKKGHKELLLTEKEQQLLENCAIYMPKKAKYNINGEIDKNVERIDELKGTLRDVQEKIPDSEMKRKKIKKLRIFLEATEKKRMESKKLYNYMVFEVYKQEYMPTSRKDTFWRNVKEIEKILSKSFTFKSLTSNNAVVRKEMLVLYYIFICLMPAINHNHQRSIDSYNKRISHNPYHIKEATPPKVVSQLKFDIDKTDYFFERDKYTKGQFLFQNYYEIEADRSLFECLLDSLRIVKESKTMETFINGLAKRIVSFSLDQGIKSIAKFDSENTLFFSGGNHYLKKWDAIIDKWDKDQDLLVRKIILELFDLKITPEVSKSIIHDEEKLKELNLAYLNIEKMSSCELQRYIDLDCDRLKRAELEDKLSSLGRIDSYFKKLCEKKRIELWGN